LLARALGKAFWRGSGGSIVATTPTPAERSESRGLLNKLVERDDDWAQTF